MIRVVSQISSIIDANQKIDAYHYKIAGQQLVFQNRVDALKRFEIGPASQSYQQILSNRKVHYERLSAANAKLIYYGSAPFENKIQDVRYWRMKHLAQVDVGGMPICQIDFSDDQISLLNMNSVDDRLNLEVITGPALITLLAKQDVYCLHAGAVTTAAGNVALIAESGTGKSTLSAHTSEDVNSSQWSQIADDILPLSVDRINVKGAYLFPDFPQLKLPNSIAKNSTVKNRDLDFILRLNPKPAETIQFRPILGAESMLQLIRHTVAAKLFGDSVMRRHARFARNVSLFAPMFEVSYPRDMDALPELRKTIVEFLLKQKDVINNKA